MSESLIPRRPHAISPSLESVHLILINHQWAPSLPGCDAGLSVTSNMTARVLRRSGVHCNTWIARDADDLTVQLTKAESQPRPITHVVLNTPNFATPAEIGSLAQRWPDIDFAQLQHTGLAYLSIDDHGAQKVRQTLDLQRAMHNVKVAGNSPRYQKWIESAYGAKPVLLPNLYDTDTFINPVRAWRGGSPLRVGSFGEGRPWKNQLVAAQGALMMARRLGLTLELYVNADRWPQTWRQSETRRELLEDLPGVQIITVPWCAWPTFRRVCGHMDVCLSPSFDETFCVCAADALAEGIPSAVTAAMDWAPKSWQIPDPHDPASVAAVGVYLLHDRIAAIHDGRSALNDYETAGVRKWISYLTESH